MSEKEKSADEKQVEVIKALIKVQQSIVHPKKTTENTYFKAKYADLLAVWNSCIEQLHENGFLLTQPTRIAANGAGMVVLTNVQHINGTLALYSEYLVNADKAGCQATGSALTYARRYALCSLLGIVPEGDDTDGEDATNHASKPEAKEVKTNVHPKASGETTVARFVPKKVTMKEGTNAKGKAWTKYSVVDDNGVWYTTFSEELGQNLLSAESSSDEIKISYTTNEKGYHTILEIDNHEKV